MAKLNPIFGKATGKVGGSVFQINGGEQIWKEKPAKVTNPNTEAQIEQRAKLKLMSQLAAALSDSIAIKKQGLQSARNLFIKKNFPLVTFADNKASCQLDMLQLTDGINVMPDMTLAAGAGGSINASFNSVPEALADKVFWACYKKDDADHLSLVEIKVVSTPGANRDFATTFNSGYGDFVVYGYGLKAKSSGSTSRYGNYEADIEQDVATLEADVRLNLANYNYTQSYGMTYQVSQ